MKVKTFHGVIPVFNEDSEIDMDKMINEWIKNEKPIIVDIKYSISGNKHYGGIGSILVMYRENKSNKKDKP